MLEQSVVIVVNRHAETKYVLKFGLALLLHVVLATFCVALFAVFL